MSIQSIEQFRSTRQLVAKDDCDLWTYGVHHDDTLAEAEAWHIVESFDEPTKYSVCGEFDTLAEAEALYRMYCDEESLYEDYH
ncbi:hypothetical protein SPHG1_08 [Salmonella phage SPHG1]|nr:hypothetical protein SPHG1_08 [Salmonella phage SPHG1]